MKFTARRKAIKPKERPKEFTHHGLAEHLRDAIADADLFEKPMRIGVRHRYDSDGEGSMSFEWWIIYAVRKWDVLRLMRMRLVRIDRNGTKVLRSHDEDAQKLVDLVGREKPAYHPGTLE